MATDTLTLLSWNIRDFGRTKDEAEIKWIARIVAEADIVAIQEVVAGYGGAQAVARLADQLNRMGHAWEYSISPPTRSSPGRQERYAFLWKKDQVQVLGRPALEMALDPYIEREPYVACFKAAQDTFCVVNFHAVTLAAQPEQEIRYLYFFPRAYPEVSLIFAGDYNLPEAHEVFDALKQKGYRPALVQQKTTLRRSESSSYGSYFSNAFDNILLSPRISTLIRSGIVDTVKLTGSVAAANLISDHVPVWVQWIIP